MGSRALIQSVSHLASDRTHPVMRSCNSVFVPLRFCVCVVSRVHMTQPFGLTVVSPLLPCVNLQRGSERERRGGTRVVVFLRYRKNEAQLVGSVVCVAVTLKQPDCAIMSLSPRTVIYASAVNKCV